MGLTRTIVNLAIKNQKIESFNTYLFVGPHPDDIEIGAGATVSKLIKLKKKVVFLICTDGRFGRENLKEDLSEEFIHDVTQLEGVVSIWQSVKTETKREVFGDMRFIWGEEKMHLRLEDKQLSLLPRSFFQLNTKQSVNLYNLVKDWMPRSKTTVEAYSGIGAISLFVKDKAQEIIGVESIQDAVDNANENAMLNHADNVSFICEDAGSALAHLVQEKEVDTLIVDPPRSGLDDTMKETILKSKIKTMIYVSCNPATLAKDLGVLKKEYRIVKIQPVDMFSQTPHVETVCLMSRKEK